MAHESIDADDNVFSGRLSGLMTSADQLALQVSARRLLDQGKQLRMLVLAEDFQGWERTEDWRDAERWVRA